MSALARELKVALQLAIAAGERALEINRGAFAFREKEGDQGPVTEADLLASRLIVNGLRLAFPHDDVLSEEEDGGAPGVPANGARLWCVDPIDGTKDYIQKNGEWSVLIGLADREVPVLGVVYQPAAPGGGKVWYAAQGQGAWLASDRDVKNVLEGSGDLLPGRRLAARKKGAGSPLVIGSRNHPDPVSEALAKRLGIDQKMIHGSVGIKLALLADGTGDLYANSAGKTSLWDLCAGDAILRESGGRLLVRAAGEPMLSELRYGRTGIQVTKHVLAMGAGWAEAVGEAVASANFK